MASLAAPDQESTKLQRWKVSTEVAARDEVSMEVQLQLWVLQAQALFGPEEELITRIPGWASDQEQP